MPLGFLGAPSVESGDSRVTKALKKAYLIIALVSLCGEITAIIYSTVAINKLAETTSAPTSSVVELLQRDCELKWSRYREDIKTGTVLLLDGVTNGRRHATAQKPLTSRRLGSNVGFLGGLFGFLMLLGLKTWFAHGDRLGRVGACVAAAALTHSCSIVNKGIAQGADRRRVQTGRGDAAGSTTMPAGAAGWNRVARRRRRRVASRGELLRPNRALPLPALRRRL